MQKLEAGEHLQQSIHSLPWREFRADLMIWLIVGTFIASFYWIYLDAPLFSGLKILLGCLSFGLFGGMLSLLCTERRIIKTLQTKRIAVELIPQKFFSVSSKMIFFNISVLLFMTVAILLMVFMDINYLLNHKDAFGPEIYACVFKGILFAFAVLFTLSVLILGCYSHNLKHILGLQVKALENISQGRYDVQVPVVSNDEFGLIAAKTNAMVTGLRERDQCLLSFGKYVTPEVSEKILKGEISPEGELSEVTILFCDLRGYTSFVERKDPKEVVKFLNIYFSEMEQTIREHNGIVLQYIGDEIEAVFGAPIVEPNHPEMAVRAALAMRQRLADLNCKREELGEYPIRHGIGIHTGDVLAGSVGSPERLVYAMVGDAVNLASRLQVLNKKFATDILVSQTTKELLAGDRFRFQSLGQTDIKGKTGKVEIFSII